VAQLYPQVLGSHFVASYDSQGYGGGIRTRLYTRVSVRVTFDWRFTANHSILATSPLRVTTNNFFQLNTCGHSPYVTCCLTRGCVCRLQLLLVLASAVTLRSESRGTHDHILLSQIPDFPNLGGPGLRIYIPQAVGSLSVAS
jgi:hypothetical protein